MSQPNSTTHYKVCPRCQAKTNLIATTCTVCGRTFNTQFSPPPAPVSPSPPVNPQPVNPLPPRPAPVYPSVYPVVPNPAGSDYLLDEITQQYNGLINWQIAGTFCLLSGPLMLFAFLGASVLAPGIVAILAATVGVLAILFPVLIGFLSLVSIGGLIYALIQKPNLSRQIAQMGINSRQWAAPMEKRYWTVVTIGVGVMVALSIFLLCILIALARAGSGNPPPVQSPYYNGYR